MVSGRRYIRRADLTFFHSAAHMQRDYEHIRVLNETGRSICFINRWLHDENVPAYNAIDMVPPPLVCPEGTLNLWKPFHLDDGAPYMHDAEGLQIILDFIGVLCSHDLESVASLIDWMYRMIEQPGVRTARAPALFGPMGCGKSTFVLLLTAILGQNKVYGLPPRWGQFNLQMQHALLFSFDEYGDDGGVRSLMTDDILRVASVPADYTIRNVARCIILSQTEPNTIDRRFFPIRCSDEHTGDQTYFDRLIAVIQSPNAIRTFWSYLKRNKGLWARLRRRLYIRSIVLYWLDLTKPLMQEGGAAFDHDMTEFEEWGRGVFG
jgi:hypothetical protein